jgi:hypothetical protein
VSIQETKAFVCDIRAGRREGESTARLAGVSEGPARISAGQDDPVAENPKETTE